MMENRWKYTDPNAMPVPLKKLGSLMKERCGDYVRTLQVVGYSKDNTHEVWEIVHEQYNPIGIDYLSMCPKRFE